MRTALRARARSIGRGRVNADLDNLGAIEAGIPFLTEELAYDLWHRMLFARFLAENDLLVHPQFGTLSVDDITNLAADDGSDPWELAAEIAATRLPGLFTGMALRLAPEDRQALATLLGSMDAHLFQASDALGWVYQFWQAQRKDEINAAGKKIGGADLSPVTQLFTEDYMVDFLLQNSLGAWFVSRYPETSLRDDLPFLRFREDDVTPAAGTFPTWPDTVAEVTVLDPCCGSGHFLVGAFHLLTTMRAEVESLSLADAADAVLRDNLFGLELDARCTQIALFAVALEAWKLGGHPERCTPQVACSGLPVAGQKADWAKLAGSDTNLRLTLENLYELFAKAPELGSLIDPKRAAQVGGSSTKSTRGKGTAPERQAPVTLLHEWNRVETQLHAALAKTSASFDVTAIFAQHDLEGTVKAADLLTRTYTFVATNVPYLSRGSHDTALRDFADDHYPEAKNDLATIFLERCLGFVVSREDTRSNRLISGSVSAVTPQNWLFLGSYKKLRQTFLAEVSFDLVARLGAGAFRTISGEVVNVALPILTNTVAGLDHAFAGIDASEAKGPDEKERLLREGDFMLVGQQGQLQNPDQRVSFASTGRETLLEEYAGAYQGIATADYARYGRVCWEQPEDDELWQKQETTVEYTTLINGKTQKIRWRQGAPMPFGLGSVLRGQRAWGRLGVAVSQMGSLPVSLFLGEYFDNNVAALIPHDLHEDKLLAIWAFCSSPEFNIAVRKIDSALKVTNASLVKVPFEIERWQQVADEQYPDGLPEPFSSDPTQWLFEGTIPGSDHPLHVAVARLLGYTWPDQVEDGMASFTDPDGIVALPSVNRELPAHDRLRALLETAYGDAWSEELLGQLLAQVEAPSLEEWLRSRKGFFAQHVKLFHNRPFIWQLTDSLKDGFSVLVNYHTLDAGTLSKLIYTYLGDWIARQERDVANEVAGAPAKLEAATRLRAKLIAIAEGEPPYDMYVRWKSLAEQPIGWNPDLNDGVRLNIRPFIAADVFPVRVNVKWGKDRGADPVVREEPLVKATKPDETDLRKRIAYHASTDRLNDLHFTNAEKRRARALVTSTGEDSAQ